jgi:phosphomannomutase
MTGSVTLAEDLVNESFLALYKALAGGEAIRNPRAWTLTVVRNLLHKERRGSRRIVEFPPGDRLTVPPVVDLHDLRRLMEQLTEREGENGIQAIEEKIESGDLPEAESPGTLRKAEIFDDYQRTVLSHLRRPEGARRLRVAVDCANGMGALYRPILEEAGIDLIPLYFELDGTFPNHEANPLKLENLRDLSRAVKDQRADLGVSFDGDADRAAFVDERGEPVGSDLSTALIAGELLARHPGGTVIYDLRSSRAVAEHVREAGGTPVRERVGHSFMKATLRERDGVFGGELAGHYYFRDMFYADSAILAVIEMLNLLWKEGKPLSALVAPLLRYAKTPETNFEVEDKEGKIRELAERYADADVDYLDGITIRYPTWWANVRPSNTEPLLRLVLEADTEEEMVRRRDELIGLLGEPV